jgi:hypothetical protein
LKDDKKKLAIIGVLGFIIVGVGAFQFMRGGSSVPVQKPAPAKAALAANAKDDGKVKNPEYAMALPQRDPFKAPGDSGMPDDHAKPPVAPVQNRRVRQPSSIGGHLANEVLPNAGGGGAFAPVIVEPTKPTFGYRLSGLISGRHPAAVFTDASGAQRLVPLSGSLDGDTQLVAVEKGRAVVSFRGKHLRLSLGGTPDAN